MRQKKGSSRPFGLTVMELLVVALISSMIVVFLFNMIRNFSDGVRRVHRFVPMQRNLQMAKFVIEGDLLSAPRSSFGNVVPNAGFETAPIPISQILPAPPGFWACQTGPVQLFPPKSGIGVVSATKDSFLNGVYGLLVNVLGNNVNPPNNYFAQSSTFSLVDATPYLFGGWINVRSVAGGVKSSELLLTNIGIPVIGLSSNLGAWKFVVSTFTANAQFYGIDAGIAGATGHGVAAFDDIIVTPHFSELTPTNGSMFIFQIFQTGVPNAGQRAAMRYRLVPSQSSGRLVREQWKDGVGWENRGDVDKIRRLWIGWDFGEAAPGMLPPPAAWPNLFSRGMNFPLAISIETGDVGAPSSESLSLSLSIYSTVP